MAKVRRYSNTVFVVLIQTRTFDELPMWMVEITGWNFIVNFIIFGMTYSFGKNRV
jgi:hypothetical protein